MKFNKVNIENWNRKESYNHYFNDVPCTYSMTVELDISVFLTKTRDLKIKFFPSFLYVISKVVNNHKEFRMNIDEDNNIGYYDFSNPYYTVFHEETESITNVWTEYNDDLDLFLQSYKEDKLKYQNDCCNSKPLEAHNVFNVSCMPWTSFKGFNLNLQKGYYYLLPIFTLGKYFESDGKVLLPLAIQVHHAVCDGFHLSRFIDDLQNNLDAF